MDTKPGYKTTEFWASTGGAAALVEVATQATDSSVQIAAIIAAAVVLSVYAVMRRDAKGAA